MRERGRRLIGEATSWDGTRRERRPITWGGRGTAFQLRTRLPGRGSAARRHFVVSGAPKADAKAGVDPVRAFPGWKRVFRTVDAGTIGPCAWLSSQPRIRSDAFDRAIA